MSDSGRASDAQQTEPQRAEFRNGWDSHGPDLDGVKLCCRLHSFHLTFLWQ